MIPLYPGPAYRIETQRLVLRCFEPGDAPCMKAAVDASLAVPRKLGFTLEATLRRRYPLEDGYHDLQVWTLLNSEYLASPSAKMGIAAYDAMGRSILPNSG